MAEADRGLDPRVCVDVVGRRSLAQQAHDPEVRDGVAVALRRGCAIPGFSPPVVHWDAAAGVICESDQELRPYATRFGGAQKVCEGAARVGARNSAVEIGRGIRS